MSAISYAVQLCFRIESRVPHQKVMAAVDAMAVAPHDLSKEMLRRKLVLQAYISNVSNI
jgi:hypothetical protein